VFFSQTKTIQKTQMINIKHPSVQINDELEANHTLSEALELFKRLFSKKMIENISNETGFIIRTSSKMTGLIFLISILSSSCYGSHSTLEKMSEIVTRVSHKIKISAQALMKRINRKSSVDFLKIIYSKVLKEKLSTLQEAPAELLAHFKKVLIQDSSSVTLNEKLQEHFKGSGGRSSKSTAKLDVIYDWKAKDYEQITLTDQGEADQTLGLNIEPFLTKDSLVIRDLGYLRVDCLAKISEKNAFFLSRLRSDTKVFLSQNDEAPIELEDLVSKKYKGFNLIDLQVYVTAKKFPVRLVIYKAPEGVANERRRLARMVGKKQGRQLREKTLKMMGYTMFITNVPPEVWKPEVIGTIYRVRWQIELLFKCWKSGAEIEHLEGINAERIRCLIYSKLILLLLINWVYKIAEFMGAKIGREVSMYKVFAWVKDGDRLIKLLKGALGRRERNLFNQSLGRMCKQKRKRKTTLQLLCEGEFYCQRALG